MDVCITVDLEHDCPPFLTTYSGVTEGMPRLLALLAAEQIPATFFCTGDVARRFLRLVGAGRPLELVRADDAKSHPGSLVRRKPVNDA